MEKFIPFRKKEFPQKCAAKGRASILPGTFNNSLQLLIKNLLSWEKQFSSNFYLSASWTTVWRTESSELASIVQDN